MPLGNFLGKLRSEKTPPPSFLALVITDEFVQAAVWRVEAGVTEIVSLGTPVELPDHYSGDTLVQAADATISAATEGLTEELKEVIFGLPPSFFVNKGISPVAQDQLKLLCRELALKPLGYVTLLDGLLAYLKSQEGTPTTALLLQLTHFHLLLSLVHLGKITHSCTRPLADDLPHEVEAGLRELVTSTPLPSRFLVFDGLNSLDETVQALAAHDWSPYFDFLHLPKVEALPRDVLIRSLAIAGGSEVAKAIGFELAPPPEQALTPVAELGFHSSSLRSASPPPPPSSPPPPPSLPRRSLPRLPLPQFKLPHLALPRFSVDQPLLVGSLALVTLAILGLIYWFVPRAVIKLTLEPRALTENVTLTLSPAVDTIDPALNTIPAVLRETTVSGSLSSATTGEKTIGDPARGEVTIYNRTELPKRFAAGTTLKSGNLTFTLDNEVLVASSSAGADYVEVPGRATAQITAGQIGADSNLPEGTEFELENYSQTSYVARNDSSLSGGSSELVRVISQTDLTTLEEALTQELSSRAEQELLAAAPPDTGLYLLTNSLSLDDATYSGNLGDLADTLELSLSITVKAITYRLTDAEELVEQALTASIPSGFTRTSALPEVTLTSANIEDSGAVTAEAKVTVSLFPFLDEAKLQTALRGLSPAEATDSLSALTGLSSAHVDLFPKHLPSFLKRMPRNPHRITIVLEPI